METPLEKLVRLAPVVALHGTKGAPGYNILHSPHKDVRDAANKVFKSKEAQGISATEAQRQVGTIVGRLKDMKARAHGGTDVHDLGVDPAESVSISPAKARANKRRAAMLRGPKPGRALVEDHKASHQAESVKVAPKFVHSGHLGHVVTVEHTGYQNPLLVRVNRAENHGTLVKVTKDSLVLRSDGIATMHRLADLRSVTLHDKKVRRPVRLPQPAHAV